MRLSMSAALWFMMLGGCGSTTSGSTSGPAHATAQTATSAAPQAATPISQTSASSMPPPALDPSRGRDVGMVFEAFLSPQQEPDEEENTPATTPPMFRSTTPSLSRARRVEAGHRGHGQIRFSRDLSRAWVDVRVEGVDPATVNMFHIHCGRPGILGPILVDFSLATDVRQNLADGLFSIELTNEHITRTVAHGHDPMGAFTMGCIIPSGSLGGAAPTKVSTIAGMAQIAMEGELYFNLHTTGQTYFGDMRGQISRAEPSSSGGEGR